MLGEGGTHLRATANEPIVFGSVNYQLLMHLKQRPLRTPIVGMLPKSGPVALCLFGRPQLWFASCPRAASLPSDGMDPLSALQCTTTKVTTFLQAHISNNKTHYRLTDINKGMI